MIPLKNNNDNNNNLNSNDNNTKNTNVKNPKTDLLRKNVAYQNPINNSLTISALANLEYGFYPKVELSANSIFKISGYGANSYNGIVRNYNEDKLKIILDYKLNRTIKNAQGNIINPTISFFGLYDGHGGNKCSNFLQENFASFLFNSEYFPSDTIQAINEAYTKSENEFKAIALDPKNNKLLDKSGSCSLTALIIDEWCFISYLGDSRGLYSFDSGNQFYQVTRDHKPNDPIERTRIEKAGGSVYKDDRVKINGQKVHVKEENLAPGLSFPYRVSPGNLAVARSLGDFGSKIPSLGGKAGTLISKPCINFFKIIDKSDFVLLGCDGIFDRLDNDAILHKIWKYKKKGEVHNDIRELCGKITDGIIKYSMQKKTSDNVSVIFIAFKNFENKMKDPNFEYTAFAKTQIIKEQVDLSFKKENNQ